MPPKRTAEEKIQRYQRKIQELSAASKPKRRRVQIIYSDSSDEDGDAAVENSVVTAQVHNPPVDSQVVPPILTAPVAPRRPVSPEEPVPLSHPVSPMEPRPVSPVEPVPTTNDQPGNLELEQPVPDLPSSASEQAADGTSEIVLDPELLQALGEFTDDTPEYGDKIHKSLAKLWPGILKKGMTKENKEKLLKDYLVPDNCRLLQAPKLNAEISAAVPDLARIRDKSLTANQQQLGFGITAINKALDSLLKGEDKKQVIHHLSSSCRILSDLHATFTHNRIKLLTNSLDKSFLHVIQDSERDETLFGNKLSDKIKAAKAIERQGLQIKKVNNPKNSNLSQPIPRANNSGNWSGPPRYQSNRGSRGGWKKFTPPPPRRPYQNPAQQTAKVPAASKPRGPTTTQ
ncbi:hypothetical protein O0L34_g19311 [Tuta absoluta]|nr:hypothetical protein O0L34_g19311 [Tuta absoluta]